MKNHLLASTAMAQIVYEPPILIWIPVKLPSGREIRDLVPLRRCQWPRNMVP